MATFDARLEPRVFAGAVLVPPLVFWMVVEGGVNTALGGQIGLRGALGLMALAYGLPLAALAWVLCSVAAYTVAPGRLIVHRVVHDKVVPLTGLLETQARGGVVVLRWPRRKLLIRTPDAAACRAAVTLAAAALPD